jgi:PII-like signaling protein
MKLNGEGTLLRVFIGEADRIDHLPLYEVIVRTARERGLAGATVLRGVQGFGAVSRVVHTAKILRLSEDLPIVVELIDTKTSIEEFIPVVDDLFSRAKCGGLMTMEKVEIITYTHGS